MRYETMIGLWEEECARHRCNYLAVEYPEFAQPGGYQMAINAKPMFIDKMLELCAPRPVLYIDGDMFIRKYPRIFDMPNVDVMARGWWVDPRSSYRLQESITVDPYTFETSGGTMFFSQSPESRKLVHLWIRESNKPYQQGKADDRILSMVFNSHQLLLSMTIIQLPIEYLWLTLDYSDRLLIDDNVYPDVSTMNQSIVIEHGECLTSEETATGAGASNDRTPRYYNFVEAGIDPVSELLHECIMFPTKEFADTCREYLDFMSNTAYPYDGNQVLMDRHWIDEKHPENNEQPFYVVPFDKKLGKRNNVSRRNIQNSYGIRMADFTKMNEPIDGKSVFGRSTYLIPAAHIDPSAIIPAILYMLSRGKSAYVQPVRLTETYSTSAGFDRHSALDKYSRSDLLFVPHLQQTHTLLKPVINFDEPILFRPGNNVLYTYLSMFRNLAEFSEAINYGAYDFISQVRIGLINPYKKVVVSSQLGGYHNGRHYPGTNQNNINQIMARYVSGLDFLYNKPKKSTRFKPHYKNKTHRRKKYSG